MEAVGQSRWYPSDCPVGKDQRTGVQRRRASRLYWGQKLNEGLESVGGGKTVAKKAGNRLGHGTRHGGHGGDQWQ
jgi:hypothetical protein